MPSASLLRAQIEAALADCEQGVLSAEELRTCRDGELVRTAGCVVTRQRPGTAKGVIFLTLEDETRHSNVVRSKFLPVEAVLQNRDNVIHVKATRLMELSQRRPTCLESALRLLRAPRAPWWRPGSCLSD